MSCLGLAVQLVQSRAYFRSGEGVGLSHCTPRVLYNVYPPDWTNKCSRRFSGSFLASFRINFSVAGYRYYYYCFRLKMSHPSEDYPVLVTSITTGTSLPPAIVLLVVIVSIVGMLFLLLILWYFLSGRASQMAKVIQMQEEEELEKIEVLREGGGDQQASHCNNDGLLCVPRVNPACSPSIFSGGLVLDGVPGLGKGGTHGSAVVITNTLVHDKDSDKDQVEEGEEALELVSVDLDSPANDSQLEGQDDKGCHGYMRAHDFLSVRDATVYVSSLSLNVFSECQETPPAVDYLHVPLGGNSPNVSFRSAINTFHPNSSSLSTKSLTSTSKCSPVFKMQFAGQGSSALFPENKKYPLIDQVRLGKEQLDCSVKRGTEF